MSGFRIRKATVADIPELVRQRRALLAEVDRPAESALDAMVAAAAPYLERAIPERTFHAWIAESEDGTPIGGGAIVVQAHPPSAHEPMPQRAHILNVYTNPDQRHRGVGRAVMETLIAWCREQGFGRVSLNASDEGRPLYEQLGFKPSNNLRLKLR